MFEKLNQSKSMLLAWPVAAFAFVVLISNIAVQYPVNFLNLQDYLTWGAFTYPFAFLITDLTNRQFGAQKARGYVYIGFFFAVLLSAYFATPRIAIASGLAFLIAQLLDISIFDKLRNSSWWKAPFISSVFSSAVDTTVFFSIAFACAPLPGINLTITELLAKAGFADECVTLPWVNWAIVDYLVKIAMAIAFIAPYGWLRNIISAQQSAKNLTA